MSAQSLLGIAEGILLAGHAWHAASMPETPQSHLCPHVYKVTQEHLGNGKVPRIGGFEIFLGLCSL